VNIADNPVVRILWAAETGNLNVVTEMLNKDASLVSATDADGYTPLHRASYEGHCQVAEVCTSLIFLRILDLLQTDFVIFFSDLLYFRSDTINK